MQQSFPTICYQLDIVHQKPLYIDHLKLMSSIQHNETSNPISEIKLIQLPNESNMEQKGILTYEKGFFSGGGYG